MVHILRLMLLLQALQGGRPNTTPARGSIDGVVVRAGAAAAGAPQGLADARVELKPGNISITTGAGGAFTFRNLAPGRYTISFSRDGFIPQEDRRRGLSISGLSITLGAGQIVKDIQLPMIPAPAIVGKVFDPHGEPLAAALVRAYHRRYSPNGTQLKIARKGMTNDLGEFRLFGLNFGNYLVSVGYSDRDRAAAIGQVRLSENVSKADDGYATVFYDGAEDISRATVAHLTPGADSPPISIILRDSPRFFIRGQVLPLIGSTKIFFAPKGSDLSEAEYFIQPNASGAFEVRGVSPGSYLLFATAANDSLSSDVVAVNVVDTDIEGVRLALQQTVTINGEVSLGRSFSAELPGQHVKLVRSSIEFDQIIDTPVTPDGKFTLEHVAPWAEYDIVVGLPPSTYVRSINSGGRNVLPGKARLVPDQLLQVALAPTMEELEVNVSKGADPAAGAQVVLIPELTLRRRGDRYITGTTGESGDVRLTALPPGRYTAYAFEQIERDAWYAFAYNPSIETRFADHAVTVIIEDDRRAKPIDLRVIPAAETAGGFN